MKDYRAVIFDFYGTLVPNFPWEESLAIHERIAEELGIDVAALDRLWSETFDDRMTGRISGYRDNLRVICEKLGVPADGEKIGRAAAMRAVMNNEEASQPHEGALELLDWLKAHGYRTALLSDCSAETVEVWPETVFSGRIEQPCFSCMEGLQKPDPRFFRLAAARLGVSPEECVYVADGMGRELHTARDLGMLAVRINTPGDDGYDHYREEWDGPVVSSLGELQDMLSGMQGGENRAASR